MRLEQMQRDMVAFEPAFISQFPKFHRGTKCRAETVFAAGLKYDINRSKAWMSEGDWNFVDVAPQPAGTRTPSTAVRYLSSPCRRYASLNFRPPPLLDHVLHVSKLRGAH